MLGNDKDSINVIFYDKNRGTNDICNNCETEKKLFL